MSGAGSSGYSLREYRCSMITLGVTGRESAAIPGPVDSDVIGTVLFFLVASGNNLKRKINLRTPEIAYAIILK